MTRLMLYGATGYTGRMAAAYAKAAGLDLIVAGRDAVQLAELGHALGVEHRVFVLDQDAAIDTALRDVAVLLNCAGPFQHTAAPLMHAGIRAGAHYLDIAAELEEDGCGAGDDGEKRVSASVIAHGDAASLNPIYQRNP